MIVVDSSSVQIYCLERNSPIPMRLNYKYTQYIDLLSNILILNSSFSLPCSMLICL